jgi:hypothetical protein
MFAPLRDANIPKISLPLPDFMGRGQGDGLFCLASSFLGNAIAFRGKLNATQWKYFVTVLMGLVHCEGSKTLSGMLQKVAVAVTISGLSRFLISPAWSAAESEKIRCQQFVQQVQPMVAQARRGRPRPTMATGYLILDELVQIYPKSNIFFTLAYLPMLPFVKSAKLLIKEKSS